MGDKQQLTASSNDEFFLSSISPAPSAGMELASMTSTSPMPVPANTHLLSTFTETAPQHAPSSSRDLTASQPVEAPSASPPRERDQSVVYIHNASDEGMGEDDEKEAEVERRAAAIGPNVDIVSTFKTLEHTLTLQLTRREGAVGKLTEVSGDALNTLMDEMGGGAVADKSLKRGKSQAALGASPVNLAYDFHTVEVAALLKRLDTNPDTGLSSSEAAARLTNNGPNALSPPKQQHWLVSLFWLFVGGFNWLLIASAVLLILSWEPLGEPTPNPTNWYIGVVLFIIVVVGMAFSAYQKRKSSNILASFRNMIPPTTTVLRDGEWQTQLVRLLQPGDIVRISIGNKVPADLRLISLNNLKLDTSMLTGESEPITSTLTATSRNHLETKNLAFFGSSVIEGNAVGVVVATGDNTVMGHISNLTGSQKKEKTTLHQEIDRFVVLVCCAALVTGVVCTIGWAAWLREAWPDYLTWQSLVVNLLSLVVAFVPEGLPLAVTMALTIVAKRMQKHNVLIKDLATIETFNTVSLICSDKTGTLTMNQMHVASLIWNGRGSADDCVFTSNHQAPPSEPHKHPVYSHLFRCATLCNGATKTSSGQVQGDASDSAIFTFCDTFVDVTSQQTLINRRVAVLPFNSKNKYMIAVYDMKDDAASSSSSASPTNPSWIRMFVKGAPEIVLARCSKQRNAITGEIETMSDVDKHGWATQQELLGQRGERVLGFAEVDPQELADALAAASKSRTPNMTNEEFYAHVFNFEKALNAEETPRFPSKGWVFNGLISLMDPPRAEVPGALAKCRSAHIRVAMVTGDHPTTGAAIAKQVGLLSPDSKLDRVVVKVDQGNRISLTLLTDDKEMGVHFWQLTKAQNKETENAESASILPSLSLFNKKAASFKPPRSRVFRRLESVDNSKAEASSAGAKLASQFVDPSTSGVAADQVTNSVYTATISEAEYDALPESERYLYSGEHSERINHGLILTGAQVRVLDQQMWDWIWRHDEIVFARTTPEQKLQIVSEAQSRGERVAVTGDGVNDAPALRKSNLGIAMQAGSEVAREAGHIILLDNNFNSIVVAVELGRTVFDNLKKVCIYLLPAGTFSEMLTVIAYLFFGIPSMLSNFQMLMISVCTDVCVSVMLVNEHAEADIMTRKPRRKDQRLVDLKLLLNAYLVQGVISFLAATINFFWYCSDQGLPFYAVYGAFNWGSDVPATTSYNMTVAYNSTFETVTVWVNPDRLYYGVDTNVALPNILNTGQSLFFVTLVITQWGNALAIRTRRQSLFTHNPLFGRHHNRWLLLGFVFAFCWLIFFTELSFFQTTFLTAPVPIKYAMVAVCWAVFIVLVDETRKYFVRTYPKGILAKIAW